MLMNGHGTKASTSERQTVVSTIKTTQNRHDTLAALSPNK